MDTPESIEFWGKFDPVDGKDSIMLIRLVISIYDHLRATSSVPIIGMKPGAAKPYLNETMMFNFFNLMGVKDLQFSEAEKRKMKEEAKADLYHAYYCALDMKPDNVPRENVKAKIWYVTRADLYNWLSQRVLADPDLMHSRINELLAREGHLFVDPFTDQRWKHPQIPRSAFPEKSNEESAALVQKQQASWLEQKEKIFISAKINRVVLPPPVPFSGPPTSSLGRMMKAGASSNSAALEALLGPLPTRSLNASTILGNTSPSPSPSPATALSVAQAELAAQRMRSQAMRNAHTERVYNSNRTRYCDYTPGNF